MKNLYNWKIYKIFRDLKKYLRKLEKSKFKREARNKEYPEYPVEFLTNFSCINDLTKVKYCWKNIYFENGNRLISHLILYAYENYIFMSEENAIVFRNRKEMQ